MSAPNSNLDVRQLFGVKGGKEDLPALRKEMDAILNIRNENDRKQALVNLVKKNEGVAGKYKNNVEGLEHELREARATMDASRDASEKVEKKGLFTRIKNGVVALPKFLWKHKWKIAIAGGVALGAWYFWPYITGYLNTLMSKVPQAALESGMGADAAILAPDVPVSPLPLTPSPLESQGWFHLDPHVSPPPVGPPLPPL